jgi:hypothetical protein
MTSIEPPPMSTEPKRTYHEQAVQDAAEERGGRWRNANVSIAGTSPIPHADKLAAPTWSHDVVPPEPPTGECIDALPSMETVSGLDLTEALAIDGRLPTDVEATADTPTNPEPTEHDEETP